MRAGGRPVFEARSSSTFSLVRLGGDPTSHISLNDKLWVRANNGWVGIGTTNPVTHLDVTDKSVFRVKVHQENSAWLTLGDSAVSGVSSAKIEFAGWGFRHGGLRWLPEDPQDGRAKFLSLIHI